MTNKYSTIFDSKLPAFIADDPTYSRFIDFFDAYYKWFDDTYNIYSLQDNLDIDSGFNEFYTYYAADFLPNFPDIDTIATDKVKLLKIVKELYKAKGVPDSFKFLFRALYNVNAEVYPTSDFLFKASDGKWVTPKSIKIKSNDTAFLNINNFKMFGETSKSIGLIEKSIINGKFIQIYLSDIRRLFLSGENIRILDNNNRDAYFLNGKYVETSPPPTGSVTLTSKIIGSLSHITINKNKRGQLYKVGDPVILEGGLNPLEPITDSSSASAIISEVTTGQIQKILITDGGYGYRTHPNSEVNVITTDGNIDSNAVCIVSIVDEFSPNAANVAYISEDAIIDNLYISIGDSEYNFTKHANANVTLQNCFSFIAFSAYPIQEITVKNGGGGYEKKPSIQVKSSFFANSAYANTADQYRQNLSDLGILAPIKIIDGGINYTTSDTIKISHETTHITGDFAFARINSVNSSGSITSVEYYYDSNSLYGVGGMGYTNDNLPLITIESETGANGNLIIPAILGSGVKYELETDRIGAITKINLVQNGENYVSTPNVYLRIQDIVVTGDNIETIDIKNSVVYQGSIDIPAFYSKIDKISVIEFNSETNEKLFSIRLYDYKGVISSLVSCNVYNTSTKINESILNIQTNYNTSIYENGIHVFGDGSAQATATFSNGLVQEQGRYLNLDGHPSSHAVLQSDIYNYSTYILSTEKDYDSYKDTIKDLLHPIGTQLITRNILKSNSAFNNHANSSVKMGKPVANISSLVVQNINSIYSNTIQIYTEESVDLNAITSIGSQICIIGPTEFNIYSTISEIDNVNSILTLNDSVQYKFPNVYNGYTSANSIIITKGNYPGNKYTVNTFIKIGDDISIGNNIVTIQNISNNIIYFPIILEQTGNITQTANVSVIKNLTSNNITIYTTV